MTAANLLRAWQVGQILKVRAENDSNPAGQLMLRIGKLKVTASTPVPLKAGAAFSAQIQSLGQTPVLKIISPLNGPPSAVAQYLRESLPRQQDFSPLMQKLAFVAREKTGLPQAVKSLARDITANIAKTDKLKPPAAIKSAIADSGVLLEARLADASLPQTAQLSDLKGQLLRLRREISRQIMSDEGTPARQESPPAGKENSRAPTAGSLQQAIDLFVRARLAPESLVKNLVRDLPADQLASFLRFLETSPTAARRPPADLPALLARLATFIQTQPGTGSSAESLLTLLRNALALQDLQQLTENALNRIQASQLSSVSRETGTAFLLLLDLPVMHGKDVQNLQLQFEKHNEAEASPEHWNVAINFNLPELGPVQARLRLQDNRLVTRFEAERTETVMEIRENLPRLQEALARTGVSVDHLSVEQGKADANRRPPPPGRYLLDEMA